MKAALRAEWTKTRTVAGPRWLLLGSVVLTIALGVAVTSLMSCAAGGCHDDTTKLSLTGVYLGQALIVILAVQSISGEYGSGLIRTTLAAIPRRGTVLAAKALTLTGLVAASGTVAVLGSLLAGRIILPGNGFTAPSLADGPTLRATTGSVLYLVLIALLSLGVAAVVRDSAAGTGIVLGLLYVFPLLSQVIADPRWQRLLERIGPMSAGLAVQTTTDPDTLPAGPWAGLGVTAGWAVAALVAGGLLLRVRDA
ncbi:ABC transporter permease subunit [Umezawaea sp. Da 62-37]|uniref:ABC transporter permease n=1 Tax=Umezawaea sp. Da 62-37 TaxID=3075927 RepID=UPI0028F72CBE|nr:ABC transporter permease subunit [Umezawaea sp. Da 62-37]WNV85611.1 ABC transporter permease subunit [Umezawaea sp. Da 62-37]